jgi:polypeptide N-acetylgalactosaminyltransferase
MLFTTVAVVLYLHCATLNALYSSSDMEEPHEGLRHSFDVKKRRRSTAATSDEPLWWMNEKEDDWFQRSFVNDKRKYHAMRDLSKLKPNYNPMCGHYRFNDTAMPDVSVIVTSQNEVSGWISTTVHSIIARTPPHLLKEVIVVDDNGILPETRGAEVDEKEYQDLMKLPNVKVIQNHGREGCARSRLIGAKAATGEVIMFVDSHIEQITSTWYQHLVLPILENPRTMAIQTIDIIDDKGTREYTKVGHAYGLMSHDFYFTWQDGRFDNWVGKKEAPVGREPFATPIGPGSLFAMRRDEFWRIGGYDEGLYVWGGENTELALKTWMCGGRVVMVPCSRVGHMFRKSPELMKKQWPPKIPKELSEKLLVISTKRRTRLIGLTEVILARSLSGITFE